MTTSYSYHHLPTATDFHTATCYGPFPDTSPQRDSNPATVDLPACHPSDADPRLAWRFSCRTFAPTAIQLDQVARLLATSYGKLGPAVTNGVEFEHRPVPSAGARYPFELFVIARDVEGLEPGCYRYLIDAKQLEVGAARPDDETMASIFLDQPYVASVPAIIMMTARVGLSLERYGSRGYRYVLFEAGHIGQNLALAAVGLGLGALPIGGFLDGEVAGLLGTDPVHAPALYGFALGNPGDRDMALARSTPDSTS